MNLKCGKIAIDAAGSLNVMQVILYDIIYFICILYEAEHRLTSL